MLFFGKKEKKTAPAPPHPVDLNATLFLGEEPEDVKTELLMEENRTAPESDARFTVRLSDLNDARRSWTLPVASEVVVGRAESCAIRFSDQSVSREQFKIVVRGDELRIVQIGKTNATKRNGVSVTQSASLHPGDVLKFGRGALRVESIQTPYGAEPDQEPSSYEPPDLNCDNTMSFF